MKIDNVNGEFISALSIAITSLVAMFIFSFRLSDAHTKGDLELIKISNLAWRQ